MMMMMMMMWQDFIDGIVDSDFHQQEGHRGHLFVLGGIQINMPYPLPDYFQPLMFECRTHGKQTVDLMDVSFGDPTGPYRSVKGGVHPSPLPLAPTGRNSCYPSRGGC